MCTLLQRDNFVAFRLSSTSTTIWTSLRRTRRRHFGRQMAGKATGLRIPCISLFALFAPSLLRRIPASSSFMLDVARSLVWLNLLPRQRAVIDAGHNYSHIFLRRRYNLLRMLVPTTLMRLEWIVQCKLLHHSNLLRQGVVPRYILDDAQRTRVLLLRQAAPLLIRQLLPFRATVALFFLLGRGLRWLLRLAGVVSLFHRLRHRQSCLTRRIV